MWTLFSQLHRLLYLVDNVGQDVLTGIKNNFKFSD